MISALPTQLLVGPTEHGVVRYARSIAAALPVGRGDTRAIRTLDGIAAERVQLHFTDRLFGASPEEAAERVVAFAGANPTSITLHDLPQASDGAINHRRRADAYRRVARAAVGVVCNSRHEADLLRGLDAFLEPTVIALPVDSSAGVVGSRERAASTPTVALVGFLYPGKGHREVVDAVAALKAPLSVTGLGRASEGHERDEVALRRHAAAVGVRFEMTGFLPDDELFLRCRTAAVPVAAHQHFSASASINTWLLAGRRPIVLDGPYTREMAELRPGTLTLSTPGRLAESIEQALTHPESTFLDEGTSLRPVLADVAAAYLDWWDELPW